MLQELEVWSLLKETSQEMNLIELMIIHLEKILSRSSDE